ncbi:MAG: hypothetical protein ACI840_001559 [Ulvibacter sp.]|jgi:hypothetical protein
MGYMYGIYNSPEEREALFEKNERGEIVRRSNLFPKDRRIDSLEWNVIVNYYLENAPDSLSLPSKKLISKNLKQFRRLIPSQKMQIPSTTMAHFSHIGLTPLKRALYTLKIPETMILIYKPFLR